jgi:diguanylate cyclase
MSKLSLKKCDDAPTQFHQTPPVRRTGGTMQTFLHLIDSVAIMAALALVYGLVRRLSWPIRVQHVFLGAAFGLGAITTMLQPILIVGDLIIDCRALFTGFAGAFLGLEGALAALAVAALGRLAIGFTSTALFGVFGLAISTMAGMLWDRIDLRASRLTVRLSVLGAMISLSYLVFLLIPEVRSTAAVPKTFGLLSIYNIMGAMALGSFIHRERAQANREAAANEAATLDPLTGLLNRRGFSTRFTRAEAHSRSRGSALLLIDIDYFKKVNDTFGHPVGDAILKIVGERLRKAVRPQDFVQRAGGEEFGVYLSDIDHAGAQAFAERVRTLL